MLLREGGEELGGGSGEDRVAPVGPDFGHGDQHEGSEVHAGMRKLEAAGITDNALTDGDEVDVDQAVDVGAGGIAVRGGAYAALCLQQAPEHRVRIHRPDFDVKADVKKRIWAVVAPWGRLEWCGACGACTESALNGGDRLPQEGVAVAEVGAYVDMGCCHFRVQKPEDGLHRVAGY